MFETRKGIRAEAFVLIALFGAAAGADRPANATRFLFDPGRAQLICADGEPRPLPRQGHYLIIPARAAGGGDCAVEIDYRLREDVAPEALDRQWSARGFVELMRMRDGVPGRPRRLYFRERPDGVRFSRLPEGAGYRVHFTLERLFGGDDAGQVWALIGIRVQEGDKVRAYYSVSRTLAWERSPASTANGAD